MLNHDEERQDFVPLREWVSVHTGTPIENYTSVPLEALMELYPDVEEGGPFYELLNELEELVERVGTLPASIGIDTFNYYRSSFAVLCSVNLQDKAASRAIDPDRWVRIVQCTSSQSYNFQQLYSLDFEAITRAGQHLSCPDVYDNGYVQQAEKAKLLHEMTEHSKAAAREHARKMHEQAKRIVARK